MISPQVRGAVEPISGAIYDWLAAEVASSSDPNDVNTILDDYETAIEGLKGGFDAEKNFTWKKHRGHMDRLPIDFENLASTPPEDSAFDWFAGKVIFDGLMEISGTFRNQCYVEGISPEDYMERRQKIVSISVGNTVGHRLIDLVPMDGGFDDARISLEGMSKRLEDVIDVGSGVIKNLINIMTLGEDTTSAAAEMVAGQYEWLKFTVDSLILVTKLKHGKLATVPFLEPRSISEQSGKLWYPLAEPIDWAAIMSTNPALSRGKSSS